MGSAKASVRLFVAAYPPRMVAARALEAVAGIPGAKPVAVEQVHLTVQFIGAVRVGEVGDVTESVRRSAVGIEAFSLTPTRFAALPERGPARLVALETDAPAQLAELHRRLAHRLARTTRKDASDRFWPHFTLCRFNPAQRVEVPAMGAEIEAFKIDRIVLVRSILKPAGAEHAALAEFPLAHG